MVRQGVGTAHSWHGMPTHWLKPPCYWPSCGYWIEAVGMANEELQGWVHIEVNRKCDSLLVQTNATRDHRQISLPHCLSATDDVTGIRSPSPQHCLHHHHHHHPPLISSAVFVIQLHADSLVQAKSPEHSLLPLFRSFWSPPRLNQLIPAGHYGSKIVILCDCHMRSQTWAVFNKFFLSASETPCFEMQMWTQPDVCHAPFFPCVEETAKWLQKSPEVQLWCGSVALTCLAFVSQV